MPLQSRFVCKSRPLLTPFVSYSSFFRKKKKNCNFCEVSKFQSIPLVCVFPYFDYTMRYSSAPEAWWSTLKALKLCVVWVCRLWMCNAWAETSVPSLHRESTDSLIFTSGHMEWQYGRYLHVGRCHTMASVAWLYLVYYAVESVWKNHTTLPAPRTCEHATTYTIPFASNLVYNSKTHFSSLGY